MGGRFHVVVDVPCPLQVDSITDMVQEKIREVAKGNTTIPEDELKEYKKRKLVINTSV